MFHILLVEDDKNLRSLYHSVLVKEGYIVFDAENGNDALDVFEHEHIDMIICDAMMPQMDGYELVRSVRGTYPFLPIMMITVLGELSNKEKGFETGIDDYMVKPINVKELCLRTKALLRRTKSINERKVRIGDTCLEYDQLRTIVKDREVILPQKEFYLLYKLFSYPDHVFTKYQLMDEIWGVDSVSDQHTLEVHIGKLREKFKNSSDFKIVTIRGLGYKVVPIHEE
jgi:two-component system OmpR family response regulator